MNAVQHVTESLLRGWHEGRRQSVDGMHLTTPAEAYEVQHQVASAMGWFDNSSARVWKLGGAPNGLISAARVPDDAVHFSGWQVPAGYCFAYGIEAEIFVRLSHDLTECPHLSCAYNAIDAWLPGIELCDTRWIDGDKVDPLLRLADRQLNRALIMGEQLKFRQHPNWNEMNVSLQVNGVLQVGTKNQHPFGDPLSSLPWLAAHAAAQSTPLQAGDLIATGSWSGLFWAPEKARIEATFAGMGSVVILT
ncbi:fumarylacetoacetate hydrolase family protein [Klebsiella sp. NPDC088457]